VSTGVVTATGVVKQWGERLVLAGVSLSLRPGRVTCLIGPNGAGKTTLVRILLRMLTPDEGHVIFRGQPLARWGTAYYKHVGAVLEAGDNTYGFMTGEENLAYLGALAGLSRTEVATRTAPYLTDMDLAGHLHRRAGDYSRGMRQKLAVIAAIMAEPQVLFLDEPTLGLDVHAKDQVLGMVRRLADQRGTACLVTSHQSDVVAGLADDIVVLDEGRVLFTGEAAGFKARFGTDESRFVVAASDEGKRAYDAAATALTDHAELGDLRETTTAAAGGWTFEAPTRFCDAIWAVWARERLTDAVISYARRVDDIESILRRLYSGKGAPSGTGSNGEVV